MKKISPAGIVIFYMWRNKFLLILRDDKPDISFPNTWTPVTGGLEEGEDMLSGGRRESDEELTIRVKKLKILGVSIKGNGFFFGRLDDREAESIVLTEGQKFDFFEFSQLSEIKIGGAFQIYLERYPEVFRMMSVHLYEPNGEDLGLAIWTDPEK
jgi:8-oxo-dGTP diphosphatase